MPVFVKREGTLIFTDIELLLRKIPKKMLFNKEHKLRHPIGIFNVSVARIINAFNEVLDNMKYLSDFDYEIENNNQKVKYLEGLRFGHRYKVELDNLDHQITFLKEELNKISREASKQHSKLLYSITELLQALNSFIEDTYHIMKTFYTSTEELNKIIFVEKWMQKAENKIAKEYTNEILEYRSSIASIVNKLKHNHARLNFVTIMTEHGKIIGYFVEGLDSSESLGTDSSIHKRYMNADTAFSLNRDLKFHLVNFFYICDKLRVFLEKIIKKKYNVELIYQNNSIKGSAFKFDTCKRIQELPNLFFPDEMEKDIPMIKIKDNRIEFFKKMNTPELLTYAGFRVIAQMTGDGTTKSFRFPYMFS